MSQIVTVYFATNRMPLTDASGGAIIDFGSELGPIDGTAVRFGSAQARVSATNSTFVPGSLYVAPEQLIGPVIQRGSRDIFERLRRDMQEGGTADARRDPWLLEHLQGRHRAGRHDHHLLRP